MQPGTPRTTRSQTDPPPAATPVGASIESTFTGENSGQVAVGSNIVQWTVHGDYVEASEEPARPRPRPVPVSVLPKRMHTFLDRDAERAAAGRALESAMTVELCGEVGQGKTAMLRYLAHNATGAYCRDGIVYLDDRDESLDDVLQYLYDTFYEYEIPYHPNEAELRLALADKCALVLVDEVALSGEELERLTNSVPKSTLVFAGDAPRVAGEVESVPLAGLPFAEALLLMQSALGRMVDAGELEAARALWEATEGNPGQIVKAARYARAEGIPLAAPTLGTAEGGTVTSGPSTGGSTTGATSTGATTTGATTTGGTTTSESTGGATTDKTPNGTAAARARTREAILTRAISGLSEAERSVLDAVRAFGRTPVAAAHIAAITAVPDALTVLEALDLRDLVELVDEQEKTYRIPADVVALAVPITGLAAIRERAVEHFAATIEREGSVEGRSAHSLDGSRDLRAVLLAAGWGIAGALFARSLPLVAWSDGMLGTTARWGARKSLLDSTLEAARRTGDRTVEAWALHQGGSRSLALGENDSAERQLRQALTIREELGDEEGAEVTRHNLGMLVPIGTPVDTGSMRKAFIIIGVAIVALIALLFYMRGIYDIAPPAALSAERTPDDSTIVQVSWEDRADNEEGFTVERATDGRAFEAIGTTPAAQTFFMDRGIDPSLRHIYRVRAFAGDDVSRYSNTDTVAPMAVLAPIDSVIGSPRLVVDTAAIDFGVVAVDSFATRRLTVVNAGNASMMLVLTRPEPPFAIADTITSMTLEPGMQQTVTLRYDPTADRTQTGVLVVDTPDDTVEAAVVQLIGAGMGERTIAGLVSALFERPTLQSGARARLEVRFDGPVHDDEVVRLRASDRDVVVASTLVVPRGGDRASTVVTLPQVRSQRTIRVAAAHDDRTITASVVVVPKTVAVSLVALDLGEPSVTGGAATKGAVRLSAPAPEGGVDVLLRSGSRSVRVPDRVHVPAGATGAGFAIGTTPVRARQSATITASLASTNVSASLVLLPVANPRPDPTPQPPLFRLTLRPAANILDVPRSGGKSSATVGISRGMRGGVTVLLESSDPKLVAVPKSVTIAPGATAAEFGFRVGYPASATTVVITARTESPGAATASAAVTVQQQQVILR